MVSWLASSACTRSPTLVGATPVWLRDCGGHARRGLCRAVGSAGYGPDCIARLLLAISHLKTKFGYDDALDAFGCHGIGGILGGVLTAVLRAGLSWTGKAACSTRRRVAARFADLGIVVTVVIVLVLDLVIAAVVKALFHGSLRVDEADEALGWMRVSTARALSFVLRTRLAASPSTAPRLQSSLRP